MYVCMYVCMYVVDAAQALDSLSTQNAGQFPRILSWGLSGVFPILQSTAAVAVRLVMQKVCMHACVHAFMYVCIYVCMYVCLYVCMLVWMYVLYVCLS